MSNFTAKQMQDMLDDFKIMSLGADLVHKATAQTKQNLKEIQLLQQEILIQKTEIALRILEIPEFYLDNVRGEVNYVKEQIHSITPDITLMHKDLQKAHNDHMRGLNDLSTNATYFKNVMSEMNAHTKSQSSTIIYGVLGVVLAAQGLIIYYLKGIL